MLQLKHYRERALRQIETYARPSRQMQDADMVFYKLAREKYRPAPNNLAPKPYVCIQIPTGGGKTLVACHSVCKVFIYSNCIRGCRNERS